MRTIPLPMVTHLAEEMQSLALCSRIKRLDAVEYFFAGWDEDLSIDGNTYKANSALDISALQTTINTPVDNATLVGLFDSPTITEVDLLSGRWDGSEVELFFVNPRESPIVSKSVSLFGNLGEVTLSEGVFQVQVRSLMQRLGQNIGELTSPTCLVRALGDARCAPGGLFADGKALSFYQKTRTVSSVPSLTVIEFTGTVADEDRTPVYGYGRCKFNTGANTGLEKEIKLHVHLTGPDRAQITLQEPFPFAVAVGDSAMLEFGCDRLKATCKDRFSNVLNYRGFAELPGSDRVLRVGRK